MCVQLFPPKLPMPLGDTLLYCMLKKEQTPGGCIISSHAQSPSSTQALSYIDFACAASCFGKTTGAGIERRGIFR